MKLFMTPEELEAEGAQFATRVAGLDPIQQVMLRQLIMTLIDIIEKPHLPAVLVRVDNVCEHGNAHIQAHCLSINDKAVDTMLAAFVAMREGVDADEDLPPNDKRH